MQILNVTEVTGVASPYMPALLTCDTVKVTLLESLLFRFLKQIIWWAV